MDRRGALLSFLGLVVSPLASLLLGRKKPSIEGTKVMCHEMGQILGINGIKPPKEGVLAWAELPGGESVQFTMHEMPNDLGIEHLCDRPLLAPYYNPPGEMDEDELRKRYGLDPFESDDEGDLPPDSAPAYETRPDEQLKRVEIVLNQDVFHSHNRPGEFLQGAHTLRVQVNGVSCKLGFDVYATYTHSFANPQEKYRAVEMVCVLLETLELTEPERTNLEMMLTLVKDVQTLQETDMDMELKRQLASLQLGMMKPLHPQGLKSLGLDYAEEG